MPKPERGRIVVVKLLDPNGRNPKRRPVVVLKVCTDRIIGVAISGEYDPSDGFWVALPWQAQGRVVTKLKKNCAAVCNWIVTFDESAIEHYLGVVPTKKFKEIETKVMLE